MILLIVKALLQWSPVALEGYRRWDAEKHAREVVEESQRAVEREIAQRGYEAAMADAVRHHAANATVEARIREMEGFR